MNEEVDRIHTEFQSSLFISINGMPICVVLSAVNR